MRILYCFCFIIGVNGINSGHLLADIYQWTDKQGVTHYSDAKNRKQKSQLVSLNPISVVKTKQIKLAKLKPNYLNNRKSAKSQSVTNQDDTICHQLKSEIRRIEEKLSHRHAASSYDQLVAKLKDLRWQKLKHC